MDEIGTDCQLSSKQRSHVEVEKEEGRKGGHLPTLFRFEEKWAKRPEIFRGPSEEGGSR
jgi:hypothetical protein